MRNIMLSTALLMFAAITLAFAQGQTAPQSSDKPAAAVSAKIEDISNWTKKQWYAAKAKWIREKAKWADCQKQATAEKLSGRKSWPFLYECMTKNS